jgi:outer membrane protein OmpA-like peptidoglycan-associated protein
VTSTTARTSTATATTTGSTAPGALRAWETVFAEAPPLQVAASLPAADKPELEDLEKRFAPVYQALGAAWKGVPTACAPKDCRKEYAAAAEAILSARDSIKSGLCGDGGGVGYRQRLRAHREFLGAVTKELDIGLTDATMKLGDATTWPRMVNPPPRPQPCLDCSMPEDPGVVADGEILGVPFGPGASKLTPEAEKALAAVPLDKPMTIRGHADPGEPDAAKLAQARATAVKDWLVKKGAKPANLTVLSLGPDLPIASSNSDAGKAKNRRVDFAYPGGRGR